MNANPNGEEFLSWIERLISNPGKPTSIIGVFENREFSARALIQLSDEVLRRDLGSSQWTRTNVLCALLRKRQNLRTATLNTREFESSILAFLEAGPDQCADNSEVGSITQAFRMRLNKGPIDEVIDAIICGETPSATLVFPVASVDDSDKSGRISNMWLRIFKSRSAGIVEDVDHAEWDITEEVKKSAKYAYELSGVEGLVSWSIPDLMVDASTKIGGNSRSAAIARALWLYQNDKKIDPRLLVIGAVDADGRLVKVGGIEEKTKAAISYSRDAIENERKQRAADQNPTTIPIDRIAIVGKEGAEIARQVIADHDAYDLLDVVELEEGGVISPNASE